MYRKNGTNSANKVYNWENALIRSFGSNKSETTLDFKGSKSFAQKVWNKWKNKFWRNYSPEIMHVSSINVLKGYGRTASAYSGFYRHKRNKYAKSGLPIYMKKLRLPSWAWNKPVICHEVAHLLAPRNSEHDENFVGVYMFLLNYYCGYDYPTMVKTLNEVDLNFTFRNSPLLYKKTLPKLR